MCGQRGALLSVLSSVVIMLHFLRTAASGYVPLAAEALEPLTSSHRDFIIALDAQAVKSGIDYATLGQGWSHPTARVEYRNAEGDSFRKSSKRQLASRERIESLVKTLAAADDEDAKQRALITAFCEEIGSAAHAANATWDGVRAALDGELLMPLRSLAEGVESMTKTFNGAPVPRAPVQSTVDAILAAVLAGRFAAWRYENPVGVRQLEGLSDAQVAKWREATRVEHSSVVTTHEDATGELGFFWATKIGGPSHGFDIEGQCLLPLLSNARHKVILVTDKGWYPQWDSNPDWTGLPPRRLSRRVRACSDAAARAPRCGQALPPGRPRAPTAAVGRRRLAASRGAVARDGERRFRGSGQGQDQPQLVASASAEACSRQGTHDGHRTLGRTVPQPGSERRCVGPRPGR